VTDPAEVLGAARTVLVVDWPSRDVPDTFVRAGFATYVHGGPAPDDWYVHELDGDEVVVRKVGRPPERADLVYTHRPVDELGGIAEHGRDLGAGAVWLQSGLDAAGGKDVTGCWLPEEERARARGIVEALGLVYLDEPYVADAVRALD